MPDRPRWLSTTEASEHFKITKGVLLSAIRAGKVKAEKDAAGWYRVDAQSLSDYLSSKEDPEDHISTTEANQILFMDPDGIRRLCRIGVLRGKNGPTGWKINREDVEALKKIREITDGQKGVRGLLEHYGVEDLKARIFRESIW